MRWQRVAAVSELTPGGVRRVVVDRIEIALVNLGGEFFAIDDVCTHAYASLSEGALIGGELECPLHGGCFDVRTGAAKGGIVTEDLRRFAVRIDGDDVLISLGDSG
ncbi:MAG: non-heme iron oxygenase ferredoxin subunit [Myxococcota bacterium]